ncbi:MAG TPA: roadblock/LC7 domain-containing protein [Chloroflexota bacterium]|nr:roadblock/LC7 domain-containing protein [Chloroflexota bacterium]
MDELKSVLQRFLAVDRVALASVAGTDGLVIDSAGHQDELDAEAVGAVATNAIGAAQALSEEVTRGRLIQAMIEFERGVVILEPISELGVLLVLTEDVSSMGRVRLVARRERKALEQALTG